MANKKQNTTIARVSDLPIMKKIWDGMYTILAYNKKNYLLDVSNIKGRKIIDITADTSDVSGGKNTIYIKFNDNQTSKFQVYNGTIGDKGKTGIDGEDGNQGEEAYIDPKYAASHGISGILHIVNNSTSLDSNAPWSAYRGKDMNDKIYKLNETFITEAEFELLFNNSKYIYAEFTTKTNNKTSTIFNADNNKHIVYKKYWTYEDEGAATYYIYNEISGIYDAVNVDLWKDIYLGKKEGYFPITASMFADDNVIYYYDQLSESYKEVTKVETPRTDSDGVTIINIYNGDKHIDNYYIKQLDIYLTADYKISNNKWAFSLNTNSELVPDVYTYDGISYKKLSKEEVLAIDPNEYVQYFKVNNEGEYVLIPNISSYLVKPNVRYFKRNTIETESGEFEHIDNNQYCEVPESEINKDNFDDYLIFTLNKLSNEYTFDRFYPGTQFGETVYFEDKVTISSVDLYYYTEYRKYYSNLLVPNEDGTLESTYVEVEIPSWIYAEFKTTDEDQISLILSNNENTTGKDESNYEEDNTIEDLDDTIVLEPIKRIVPGVKEDIYHKNSDGTYTLVDLNKDSIYATAEYAIYSEGEYVKIDDVETYLSTYDMVLFNGEPIVLPLTIYPNTSRSYVTVEYDPTKLIFFENGRIVAAIGDDYETQIKVSSENSDAEAYINLRVTTPVKQILFNEANKSLVDINNSIEFKYDIYPETANNKNIIWSDTNNLLTFETVSTDTVRITGNIVGTTKIKASAADTFGANASFNIEVVQPAQSVSWREDDENIRYIDPVYYTEIEVIEYNVAHAEEITAGILTPITTNDIKVPGYYQMIALLYKEYEINPLVLPVDTSYPQLNWYSSNQSIANIGEKTVKVIDQEAKYKIIEQSDIDNNLKDAYGNTITEAQLGENILIVKELSHNELRYIFNSFKTGEVEITGEVAQYPHLKLTVTVRVDQAIEQINVSPSAISMNINTKKKLDAEILPATVVNGTISWYSKNENIARVSPTGVVTTLGIGSTNIIAHAEDGSGVEGSCAVTVTIPAKDITLNGDTINGIVYLGIGKTTTITNTVDYDPKYQTGSKLGINWLSTDETVATVNGNGVVTGISVGDVTIIANAQDGSGVFGSIKVKVIKLAENLSFDFTEIEMDVNDSLVLIPNFEPIDTTNEIVIWNSSDETIAKVKESGIVYARKSGTATITATSTDGTNLTATCNITVL